MSTSSSTLERRKRIVKRPLSLAEWLAQNPPSKKLPPRNEWAKRSRLVGEPTLFDCTPYTKSA